MRPAIRVFFRIVADAKAESPQGNKKTVQNYSQRQAKA